jgi:MFS family permease
MKKFIAAIVLNSNYRALLAIYIATLFVSFSYGIFLSLPLFINSLGGNELYTGKILWVSGIGTIACILLSKRFLKYVNNAIFAGLGALLYSLGAAGFFLTNTSGDILYVLGFILGGGWGIYYNSVPILLSYITNNTNRSAHFSYLSAFFVLGTGAGPTLINYLYHANPNFKVLFLLAAICSFIGATIFYLLRAYPFDKSIDKPTENRITTAWRVIIRSEAVYPLVMVFLGACAFTIMINFQTTYAKALGFDYSIFYITYSLAVVGSRFLLGKLVGRCDSYKATIFLLVLMSFSLFLFLDAGRGWYLYGLSSALFGIGYGLVYPVLQTSAINSTRQEYRAEVISYFSLSYFIAVYAFPILGGYIITKFGYNHVGLLIAIFSVIELLIAIFQYLRKNVGFFKFK